MENVTLSVSLVNATDSKHTYDENHTVTENNVQGSGHPSQLYEDIVIAVVCSVFCLLGIIGNSLVVWLGIFRMKKTVNVVWYLSLAIADFLFAFSHLLDTTQVLLAYRLFVKFMCFFSNVSIYINMVVSVLQIIVISVDRCICVMFPVWCHNHRRPRLAFIIVLIIWIISIPFTISYALIIDTYDIDNTTECFLDIDKSTERIIRILEFVFLFLLPFIIIVSCYIVIVLHLRRKRIFTSSQPLKTIVAVITAFFICWFPIHLFFLLLVINSKLFSDYVIYYGSIAIILLMAIKSCINPVIYVLIGQDFKGKFCGSFQAKIEKAFTEEDYSSSKVTMKKSSYNEQCSVML